MATRRARKISRPMWTRNAAVIRNRKRTPAVYAEGGRNPLFTQMYVTVAKVCQGRPKSED